MRQPRSIELQAARLPVRIVIELLVSIALSFFTIILWYITQPIVVTIIESLTSVATDLGHFNAFVSAGKSILSHIVYWWGPILAASFVLLWLYIAAQRHDWRGHYE